MVAVEQIFYGYTVSDEDKARRRYFAIKNAIENRKTKSGQKISSESDEQAKARRRHFAIKASVEKRQAKSPRQPHCYRCKTDLDSQSDDSCSSCGWIRCVQCSACGCYYG
jgi:hypothetical protein